MKQEQKESLEWAVRFIVLGVFCLLYAIAGSGDFWGGQLWLRRWLAPFILCAAGAILSKGDWRSFAFYPIMAASLCLPYGADVLWQKIGLRALCGFAAGISFNLYNFYNYRIVSALTGVLFAFWGSIIFGVFNPWPNAIIEQALIGACYAMTYIFSVRPRSVK